MNLTKPGKTWTKKIPRKSKEPGNRWWERKERDINTVQENKMRRRTEGREWEEGVEWGYASSRFWPGLLCWYFLWQLVSLSCTHWGGSWETESLWEQIPFMYLKERKRWRGGEVWGYRAGQNTKEQRGENIWRCFNLKLKKENHWCKM